MFIVVTPVLGVMSKALQYMHQFQRVYVFYNVCLVIIPLDDYVFKMHNKLLVLNIS